MRKCIAKGGRTACVYTDGETEWQICRLRGDDRPLRRRQIVSSRRSAARRAGGRWPTDGHSDPLSASTNNQTKCVDRRINRVRTTINPACTPACLWSWQEGDDLRQLLSFLRFSFHLHTVGGGACKSSPVRGLFILRQRRAAQTSTTTTPAPRTTGHRIKDPRETPPRPVACPDCPTWGGRVEEKWEEAVELSAWSDRWLARSHLNESSRRLRWWVGAPTGSVGMDYRYWRGSDHDLGVRPCQSARNEIDKGLIASVRRRPHENESLPWRCHWWWLLWRPTPNPQGLC